MANAFALLAWVVAVGAGAVAAGAGPRVVVVPDLNAPPGINLADQLAGHWRIPRESIDVVSPPAVDFSPEQLSLAGRRGLDAKLTDVHRLNRLSLWAVALRDRLLREAEGDGGIVVVSQGWGSAIVAVVTRGGAVNDLLRARWTPIEPAARAAVVGWLSLPGMEPVEPGEAAGVRWDDRPVGDRDAAWRMLRVNGAAEQWPENEAEPIPATGLPAEHWRPTGLAADRAVCRRTRAAALAWSDPAAVAQVRRWLGEAGREMSHPTDDHAPEPPIELIDHPDVEPLRAWIAARIARQRFGLDTDADAPPWRQWIEWSLSGKTRQVAAAIDGPRRAAVVTMLGPELAAALADAAGRPGGGILEPAEAWATDETTRRFVRDWLAPQVDAWLDGPDHRWSAQQLRQHHGQTIHEFFDGASGMTPFQRDRAAHEAWVVTWEARRRVEDQARLHEVLGRVGQREQRRWRRAVRAEVAALMEAAVHLHTVGTIDSPAMSSQPEVLRSYFDDPPLRREVTELRRINRQRMRQQLESLSLKQYRSAVKAGEDPSEISPLRQAIASGRWLEQTRRVEDDAAAAARQWRFSLNPFEADYRVVHEAVLDGRLTYDRYLALRAAWQQRRQAYMTKAAELLGGDRPALEQWNTEVKRHVEAVERIEDDARQHARQRLAEVEATGAVAVDRAVRSAMSARGAAARETAAWRGSIEPDWRKLPTQSAWEVRADAQGGVGLSAMISDEVELVDRLRRPVRSALAWTPVAADGLTQSLLQARVTLAETGQRPVHRAEADCDRLLAASLRYLRAAAKQPALLQWHLAAMGGRLDVPGTPRDFVRSVRESTAMINEAAARMDRLADETDRALALCDRLGRMAGQRLELANLYDHWLDTLHDRARDLAQRYRRARPDLSQLPQAMLAGQPLDVPLGAKVADRPDGPHVGYSPYPQPSVVNYIVDLERQEAIWRAGDQSPDPAKRNHREVSLKRLIVPPADHADLVRSAEQVTEVLQQKQAEVDRMRETRDAVAESLAQVSAALTEACVSYPTLRKVFDVVVEQATPDRWTHLAPEVTRDLKDLDRLAAGIADTRRLMDQTVRPLARDRAPRYQAWREQVNQQIAELTEQMNQVLDRVKNADLSSDDKSALYREAAGKAEQRLAVMRWANGWAPFAMRDGAARQREMVDQIDTIITMWRQAVDAHTGVVEGLVVNRATDQPVAGASVYMAVLDEYVVTPPSGRFRFDEVPVGSWPLDVALPGYRGSRQWVDVMPGQRADARLVLAETRAEDEASPTMRVRINGRPWEQLEGQPTQSMKQPRVVIEGEAIGEPLDRVTVRLLPPDQPWSPPVLEWSRRVRDRWRAEFRLQDDVTYRVEIQWRQRQAPDVVAGRLGHRQEHRVWLLWQDDGRVQPAQGGRWERLFAESFAQGHARWQTPGMNPTIEDGRLHARTEVRRGKAVVLNERIPMENVMIEFDAMTPAQDLSVWWENEQGRMYRLVVGQWAQNKAYLDVGGEDDRAERGDVRWKSGQWQRYRILRRGDQFMAYVGPSQVMARESSVRLEGSGRLHIGSWGARIGLDNVRISRWLGEGSVDDPTDPMGWVLNVTPPVTMHRYDFDTVDVTVRDAYVAQGESEMGELSGRNFGDAPVLEVASRATGERDSNARTYLKFDPRQFNLPTADIESVALALTKHRTLSGHVIEAKRVISRWRERGGEDSAGGRGLSWANQPVTGERVWSRATVTDELPARWDITELTRGWLEKRFPNHGLMLASRRERIDRHRLVMHSREAEDPSVRPRVTVSVREPMTRAQWLGVLEREADASAEAALERMFDDAPALAEQRMVEAYRAYRIALARYEAAGGRATFTDPDPQWRAIMPTTTERDAVLAAYGDARDQVRYLARDGRLYQPEGRRAYRHYREIRQMAIDRQTPVADEPAEKLPSLPTDPYERAKEIHRRAFDRLNRLIAEGRGETDEGREAFREYSEAARTYQKMRQQRGAAE